MSKAYRELPAIVRQLQQAWTENKHRPSREQLHKHSSLINKQSNGLASSARAAKRKLLKNFAQHEHKNEKTLKASHVLGNNQLIGFNPLLHICDKITICQRTNIKALGEKAEDSLHLMLGFDVGHRYMQGKRSKGRDENYRIDNTNHITNTMGAKDLTLQ